MKMQTKITAYTAFIAAVLSGQSAIAGSTYIDVNTGRVSGDLTVTLPVIGDREASTEGNVTSLAIRHTFSTGPYLSLGYSTAEFTSKLEGIDVDIPKISSNALSFGLGMTVIGTLDLQEAGTSALSVGLQHGQTKTKTGEAEPESQRSTYFDVGGETVLPNNFLLGYSLSYGLGNVRGDTIYGAKIGYVLGGTSDIYLGVVAQRDDDSALTLDPAWGIGFKTRF